RSPWPSRRRPSVQNRPPSPDRQRRALRRRVARRDAKLSPSLCPPLIASRGRWLFARAASSRADWPNADPWSLELEHEDGPGLGYDRRGFVDCVEAVLDAAGIEVPTCGDGDVLLAVDLEGGGHTNHAGGRWEAPQLIPRARIERAELPVGRSTREYDIPARYQERRPEDRFEVVLPDALARIQVPGLELAKVIGGTHAGANRPKDAFYSISRIQTVGIGRPHVTLREKGANIVVRRNVEKLRLRAPCLRWPVLAAADTRAEFAALVGARTLRFIDDGSSCLRVNRLEHVVIRERKGVEK